MDLAPVAFVAWALSWVLYKKFLHRRPLKTKRNPDGSVDIYYFEIPPLLILVEGFFGCILFPAVMIIQFIAALLIAL